MRPGPLFFPSLSFFLSLRAERDRELRELSRIVEKPAFRSSCARTAAGSRLRVSGSTSTNTGSAPQRTIELADAKKLNGVVITQSPRPTPAAASASHNASVPEAQPTASAASANSAISLSSASTSGPSMNCCEAQTRSMAVRTSSRIEAYCRERSSIGTDVGTDLAFFPAPSAAAVLLGMTANLAGCVAIQHLPPRRSFGEAIAYAIPYLLCRCLHFLGVFSSRLYVTHCK